MERRHGHSLGFKPIHLLDDNVVLHQELFVLLVWTAAGEGPARSDSVDMEVPQDGLLDVVWDGHVVFNRV
jgi:hypothetical protein